MWRQLRLLRHKAIFYQLVFHQLKELPIDGVNLGSLVRQQPVGVVG